MIWVIKYEVVDSFVSICDSFYQTRKYDFSHVEKNKVKLFGAK